MAKSRAVRPADRFLVGSRKGLFDVRRRGAGWRIGEPKLKGRPVPHAQQSQPGRHSHQVRQGVGVHLAYGGLSRVYHQSDAPWHSPCAQAARLRAATSSIQRIEMQGKRLLPGRDPGIANLHLMVGLTT